ncbi:hypothetical protein AAC387_Pa12g0706 [Persea americana]
MLLFIVRVRSFPTFHLWFQTPRSLSSRVMSTLRYKGSHTHMDRKTSLIEEEGRKRATLRLSNISSFKAELLEIHSEDPSLHIFLVPGNPGVVSFYKDFVEEVFELLDGNASITAIGHTSHTGKYLDFGRLFSLQDQINHKVDLIKQEVANKEIPIILVGHSIGSYISLEIFKRLQQQVKYYIGLYPFMTMNEKSSRQSRLVKITASSILRGAVSFSIALLGLLPNSASELLVRNLIGQSWSTTAVEAACTRLLRFHTMQNVLYMAMTEFQKLSEGPDWTFMREKRKQIAYLFGDDDHWGPLTLYEQICKQVPDVAISIEREGHTHSFSCTEAGSIWVARHVVNLIRNQTSS